MESVDVLNSVRLKDRLRCFDEKHAEHFRRRALPLHPRCRTQCSIVLYLRVLRSGGDVVLSITETSNIIEGASINAVEMFNQGTEVFNKVVEFEFVEISYSLQFQPKRSDFKTTEQINSRSSCLFAAFIVGSSQCDLSDQGCEDQAIG